MARYAIVSPDRTLSIEDASGPDNANLLDALQHCLDVLQRGVGGYIAPLPTSRKDYGLYLNEDGYALGLPSNLGAMVFLLRLGCVPAQIPVGPLVICGRHRDGDIGLTDEQVAELRSIEQDTNRDQSTGADWRS